MTTSLTLLERYGVLELCERICAAYGVTLSEAVADATKGRAGKARRVLYAVLFVLGWRQSRISQVFGCDGKTVANALDSVKMSEVRQFVPINGVHAICNVAKESA